MLKSNNIKDKEKITYLPLCKLLIERNKDDLNKFWAYSRIDTVKRPDVLMI